MTSSQAPGEAWGDVDPFELPEWLGTHDVLWRGCVGTGGSHVLTGELIGGLLDDGAPLACDLVAVDEAYPRPVAPEAVRQRVHLAWRSGEVSLLTSPLDSDRLALAVPGCTVDAGTTMDAVARLARAVGASPRRWSVQWRLSATEGRR